MRILLLFLLISQFSIAQRHKDHLKKNKDGYTFKVDDVKTTTIPLYESKFQDIAEEKFERPLFAFPDELEKVILAPSRYNSFMYAIHTAYADHRPLILSPDDVWLTLCQGFGNHLVLHGEELEDKLLLPNHPDKILIVNHDLQEGEPDAWAKLVEGFTE
ncbi:MAG: DUF4419 domain-containing protein, partial [Crocinitomicaceae bacterium]|nr:DUF4419 domain-containing protein [Crocinitomicaceae bacterium]